MMNIKYRSLAIAKQLMQEPSIIEGKTIAVTMSNKPEVDTIAIIEELWRRGKRVVVPKCTPATRAMTFYEINGFFQTETCLYGHFRADRRHDGTCRKRRH